MHCSSWGQRCIHSATHSSRFKPLSLIILPSQGYCWIGKNTNKKLPSCVMVLITRPSSTLKFQFDFGFNEYLWAIFPLLSLENFWFYILAGTFILLHRWLQVTSYPCLLIKILSAKTTKYIPKCWERSAKGKSSFNFISHYNLSSDQHFYRYWCMVQSFLKILWWRFSVHYSE